MDDSRTVHFLQSELSIFRASRYRRAAALAKVTQASMERHSSMRYQPPSVPSLSAVDSSARPSSSALQATPEKSNCLGNSRIRTPCRAQEYAITTALNPDRNSVVISSG